MTEEAGWFFWTSGSTAGVVLGAGAEPDCPGTTKHILIVTKQLMVTSCHKPWKKSIKQQQSGRSWNGSGISCIQLHGGWCVKDGVDSISLIFIFSTFMMSTRLDLGVLGWQVLFEPVGHFRFIFVPPYPLEVKLPHRTWHQRVDWKTHPEWMHTMCKQSCFVCPSWRSQYSLMALILGLGHNPILFPILSFCQSKLPQPGFNNNLTSSEQNFIKYITSIPKDYIKQLFVA